jgi:thiamine pyrophosphate-dependent acetolactate synthase large subunit-like protein
MSTRGITARQVERPAGIGPARSRPQYFSDLVTELLGALGYNWVSLTAGASYRGLHDSLVNYHGNQQPQMLNCTHEEIAVALAHGYAKATGGGPALVILHDLVGVMHAPMALYNAWCDRMPLLILGGSGPSDPAMRRPIEFVHSANTQGDLVHQVVKWHDEPSTQAAVIDAILRGHRIANTPPCGPVYISVDTHLQEQPLSPALSLPDPRLGRFAPPPPLYPDPAAVEKAAEILLSARLPIVVGGSLSYRSEAGALLVELVETLGGAYLDDSNFISFPTRHPLNLSGDTAVMKEADVLLMVDVPDVGATLGLYADAEGRRTAAPSGQQVIALSLAELAVNSWSYYGGETPPADIRLLADPIAGMRRLLAVLKAQVAAPEIATRLARRREEMARRHQALAARYREAEAARAASRELSNSHLVDLVWEAVKGRPCTLSGRNLTGWPQGVWEFNRVGEYLGNNAGGGVGYGPGGAVGAALAAQEKGKFPVAIIGDGDMVMAAGAMWTAAHYRIPLLVVISNNRSFGNDEAHQRRMARYRERPVENAWIGTAMIDPEIDYAAISRGFGAWAKGPITSVAQCRTALREAVAEVERGGVAVVDVRTVR